MTPEQHLNTAENMLRMGSAQAGAANHDAAQSWLLQAIGHALIAHAIEAGVPHQAAEFGGGAPGAYPSDPRL